MLYIYWHCFTMLDIVKATFAVTTNWLNHSSWIKWHQRCGGLMTAVCIWNFITWCETYGSITWLIQFDRQQIWWNDEHHFHDRIYSNRFDQLPPIYGSWHKTRVKLKSRADSSRHLIVARDLTCWRFQHLAIALGKHIVSSKLIWMQSYTTEQ
jgi:hypothetical protein